MNILITGAAGGIGSTLIRELKFSVDTKIDPKSKMRVGHPPKLYLLDNLRNGYESNLIDLNGDYYGEWDRRSVTNHLNDLWTDVNFDAVIHLAAITSLPDCEENFVEAFDVNVTGTANILNFCKKRGVKKIIFASTSAVYENNDDALLTEDLQPSPSLFYSSTKLMAENICNSFRKNYGMKIATLRFFNVFGPRQDHQRENPPLLNYLVKQFCNNESPILHSDGKQSRDYVHVDDVVDMIKTLLHQEANDTYNVCSGVKVSVSEMAELVRSALKSDNEIVYRDASKLWDTKPNLFTGNHPLKKEIVTKETNKTSLGSFKKAKEHLGWSPNTDLENLIKMTATQMRDLYFKE